MDVLERPVPNRFFKYRSVADGQQMAFLKTIVAQNQLFWSSPLDFNDPFDCAPVPVIQGSSERRKHRMRQMIRRNAPNATRPQLAQLYRAAELRDPRAVEEGMRQANIDLMRDTAVCSLSELNDSVLMWSHYADQHRGVCLEFQSLMQLGWERVRESNLYFEKAFPISYSIERPKIDLLSRDTDSLFPQTLLTKADYWKYEKEWRLIDYKGGPGLRLFPAICLTGIVFGAKLEKSKINEIMSLANLRVNAPKYYQSHFHETLFALQIEAL